MSQFRLPHLFMSRLRVELDRGLPRVTKALGEAGTLRFDPLALAPPALAGERQAGDGDYEMLTGRRPVIESVIARLAESTPGVTIRRGVWSSKDIALTEAQMTGSADHVSGPWRYERIDGIGHWMQLEVNRLLLGFLRS